MDWLSIMNFRSRALLSFLILAASGAMAGAGELKPGPRGIYALLPSFNSERPVDLARPVLENPLVRGVTVRAVWRNVQPLESRID